MGRNAEESELAGVCLIRMDQAHTERTVGFVHPGAIVLLLHHSALNFQSPSKQASLASWLTLKTIPRVCTLWMILFVW